MLGKIIIGAGLVVAGGALGVVLGFGAPRPGEAPLSGRVLKLEEFFDGPLIAWGQFQDRFGKLRRQFEVRIAGRWDGEVLTLVEDFTYEDGSTEERVWALRKTGETTWEGTAPGVIGKAEGEVRGDRFNWRYTIDLPIPEAGGTRRMRVSFDDWIWLTAENRAFNRAYMSKWGVILGDVSIAFEKL